MDDRAFLLWDQGGVWSLMAWEACTQSGLPLWPINAQEIRDGGLRDASLLMVPGGWPSLKTQALGKAGKEAIGRFVRRGGNYLGLCGGAGIALSVEDGLGLLPVSRAAGRSRVPSVSGPVWVQAAGEHPMWHGLTSPALFHVWFPGQFAVNGGEDIQILGIYGHPGPGLCTADWVVDQVDPADWPELERAYGVRLDPARLLGQAAVIGARVGLGEVVLSYLHLDTPGDASGALVLKNLWQRWLGEFDPSPAPPAQGPGHDPTSPAVRSQKLWAQGEELGLWKERHPCMPLWQRGSRGLEFWTLLRLCRAAMRLDPGCKDHVSVLLAPIWELGPLVLRALAAPLRNAQPDPKGQPILKTWFPGPHRVDGEMLAAFEGLEKLVLRLIRTNARLVDNPLAQW